MNICEKYFLESTNDTADRSAEIEAKLKEYGTCILGSGTFYVSGVKMPDFTGLMGLGPASKIVLLPEVESGAAVTMGSRCTVKSLQFFGGGEAAVPENVGGRHGIMFVGKATADDWGVHPKNGIIEGCYFFSFSGGGLTCVDTGYSTSASLTASNCHFMYCGVGINISHFSEYHEFTNMLCSENLYGCINNGGNNVFTNCGFNSNKTGFVIDNSMKQSINNSHGSVVGCTFNHNDHNKGIGIHIMRATSGHVFTGCQIFYSKVIVEDSMCITFNACNCGRDTDITVKDGTLTTFTGCMFHSKPIVSVQDNDKVKFVGCYTVDGNAVEV